jgi:3-oxoacyl-[acyl-carrier protein] reductase
MAMDLGIRGKVAVVLGASKGMGRACAEALDKEGCLLALCAREAKPIEELFPGPDALVRACDVTKDADREAFVAAVVARFGRIDILVNNCGGPKPGPFGAALSAADWQEAFERSLLQVVKWTEAAVPHMKGWGRIVNIVSTTAKQPNDALLLSNSIRPGVIGYSKTASRELARRGITINSILPGLIRTDRAVELAEFAAKREGITVEKALDRRAEEIPAGRLGHPAEIGAAVAFLCSVPAAYITGTTLVVDGGATRAL